MNLKDRIVLLVLFLVSIGLLFAFRPLEPKVPQSLWQFQSIDTMKYSRDLSREKLSNPSFDAVIDRQIKAIADTGATHVAIATPYDEEFFPMLLRWVTAARKYHLKVWFRGNFSGWEKWFDHTQITRIQHIQMTKAFILAHKDIFQDGDVFTACPECENGGPGDPRKTGDVTGHRNFLIDEYKVTKQTFSQINKKVASNYDSMNADVARLIMDQETTKALDGVVVIDHYVATPEKLNRDITEIALSSGGKIVLGEFGAPIPDIHGNMTEEQQATWISKSFQILETNPHLIGMNYWVNEGGSTSLWTDAGKPKRGVKTITTYYMTKVIPVTTP